MAIPKTDVRNQILMLYDIPGYTSFSDYHTGRGEYDIIKSLTVEVIDGCNEIIAGYKGSPQIFTGDGFLSAFPEDNSENALDAAIEIHNFAKRLRKKEGFPKKDLYLKAAIHKEPCPIVRFKVSSQYVPIGRLPSKTAGIEKAARPGETLATSPVVNPVLHKYDVEKVKVYIKGITSQNTIYTILGKR